MTSYPFKFLDSYTKEDKDIFFGRESEIEKLYSLVFESKTLLVYGISGTGKSSLIHCGLANKFNEADWLPINIRRGNGMLESLWAALEKIALTPLKKPEKITVIKVKKAIQSIYLDHFKPIFFIFDQFEELFVFGSKEEQHDFLQIVKSITESDIASRFIFVIREEYLAWFTEFESEIPSILDNRLRIEKMTRENARQAIEGPCQLVNIGVEEGFSQILLEKLSPKQNQVELTYLQVYLDKLYRLSQAQKKENENAQFTKSLIDQSGNITDLLGSFLEEQIAQLNDPASGLKVLKAFVSTQGTKRQINLQEAQNYIKTLGAEIELNHVSQLITQFVNLRILRDKNEADRFELRHDALAAKIFEKITREEKELLEIRQFVEHAFNNYEKRGILLNQEDLDYVQPFLEKLHLPEDLESFIYQSQAISRESIQKQRKLNWISMTAFWLILVFIVFQLGMVVSNYLGTKRGEEAIFTKDTAPVASLMRALETVDKNNTAKAEKTMLDCFEEVMIRMDKVDSLKQPNNKKWSDFTVLEHKRKFLLLDKIPLSKKYYTLDDSFFLQIWDENFTMLDEYMLPAYPESVRFSSNGNMLAFTDKDSTLYLYEKGKCIFQRKTDIPNDFPKRKYALSPNGKNLIFVDCDTSWYFNIRKNKAAKVLLNNRLIHSIDYSNNNNLCALSSTDTMVFIYNFQNDSNFLFSKFQVICDSLDKPINIQFNKTGKYLIITQNKESGSEKLAASNFYKLDGTQSDNNQIGYRFQTIKNIELINDKGFITFSTRFNDLENTYGIRSFEENSPSTRHFFDNKPSTYSITTDSTFNYFLAEYRDNNYKLIYKGIAISTFEFENLIFSHCNSYLIGYNGNHIYKKPFSSESIKKYLSPLTLESLMQLDDIYL